MVVNDRLQLQSFKRENLGVLDLWFLMRGECVGGEEDTQRFYCIGKEILLEFSFHRI